MTDICNPLRQAAGGVQPRLAALRALLQRGVRGGRAGPRWVDDAPPDPIGRLMIDEGLSFVEAVERLAQERGLQ